MTHGFSWHRRSKRSIATFSAFEADLLRSLAAQLIELLRNEAAVPKAVAGDDFDVLVGGSGMDFSGPTTVPDDPVLARLFPTAYPDDEEAAGDFRRFTEGGLRDGKARGAEAIIDALEAAGLPEVPEDGLYVDVELDHGVALTWMRSLTDMRLAIGTRLDVEEGDEDFWDDLPDDDPRGPVHDIYLWLGFLQETLIDSIG